MFPNNYCILPQQDSSLEEKEIPSIKIGHRKTFSRVILYLSLTLLASVCLNLVFAYHVINSSPLIEPLSKYARLARDFPLEIRKNSTYNHPNRQIEDAAWASVVLRAENGAVALDDSFTEGLGLPHAMRWPWDKRKGVYEIISSHEMHCLHVLRNTINEAHDGVPVHTAHSHVMHCLNLLRETVMCNADDTPLYTGRLHAEAHKSNPSAGTGMIRMCRNWEKLQAWEREHSACYQPSKPNGEISTEKDKYKFCPDGSRPWEKLKGH